MTHSISFMCFRILILLVGFFQVVQAQSLQNRWKAFSQNPKTYYKFAFGGTVYGGDTDANPTGSIKKYWDDKGWVIYAEAGTRLSRRIEVGGSFQLGEYPEIEPREYPQQVANNFLPNQTLRPMLHGWGRYNINLDAKVLTHFQVGIPLLFGHYYSPKQDADGVYRYRKTPTIGSGIALGLGISYPLTQQWSIFAETHQDLIFPDKAADSGDFGRDFNHIDPNNPYRGDFNDYDWLSAYNFGIRFNKGKLQECSVSEIEQVTGTQIVAAGQTASFSAQTTFGTPPIEYFWDFGDGETTIGKFAEHVFATPGIYDVKFSTLNCEKLQTKTVNVEVVPAKQNSGCNLPSINRLKVFADNRNPKLLTFVAEVNGGTAPLNYQWDFGDGESSLLINPTHEFSQAGTYTAVFKVENCGGTLVQSQTITVYEQYQPQQECVNLEMPFVYFEQNQSRLNDAGRNALIGVIPKLRRCVTVDLQIVGYASQHEANKNELSLQRATAVQQYLQRNGIGVERMQTQGYGEAPSACVTAFECSRNRRVSIFLKR